MPILARSIATSNINSVTLLISFLVCVFKKEIPNKFKFKLQKIITKISSSIKFLVTAHNYLDLSLQSCDVFMDLVLCAQFLPFFSEL